MNKAHLTNLITLACLLSGYLLRIPLLVAVGSYALSGAITNHLAIHMLFEKIPGIYGSGVIQLQFEQFKGAIKKLMMDEFFNQRQLAQFVEAEGEKHVDSFNLSALVDEINFDNVFENLAESIMESQLGGMLNMFGGKDVLYSFKPQFIEKLKLGLVSDDVQTTVKTVLHAQFAEHVELNVSKIEDLIDNRLNELTPKAVKRMIQDIIHHHLGWLVVWGGVFGGLIGCFISVTRNFSYFS